MMWASGRYDIYMSPVPSMLCIMVPPPTTTEVRAGNKSLQLHSLDPTIDLCLMGTPFGEPVEPEVYITQHTSSLFGGVGANGLSFPICLNSSKLMTLSSGCAFLRACRSLSVESSALSYTTTLRCFAF